MEIFVEKKHKHTLDPKNIFKEYYSRLCDYASRFMDSFEEAEDVVQDVFVVYLEKWKTVQQHPEAIKSFLYSTVKYTCLNKIRHGKIGEKVHKELLFDIEDDHHTLKMMIISEVVGELHQALKLLPEGCEQVLRLGYLEGLKNSQIAETLGISLNTVKSQKQRALMLLRKRMRPLSFAIFILLLM